MWPPMRPSTFSGSSRLTCAPAVMRENEVRVQVSFARSALNESGVMFDAVRQTPLTATLLPSFSSRAVFGALMVMRWLSPLATMLAIVPTSSTSPVNMGVLLALALVTSISVQLESALQLSIDASAR